MALRRAFARYSTSGSRKDANLAQTVVNERRTRAQELGSWETPEPGQKTEIGLVARSRIHSNKTTYKFLKQKGISFIGAPFSYGQGLRGVAKGADAIRHGGIREAASVLGWDWKDCGNVDFKAAMDQVECQATGVNVKNCEKVGAALGALHEAVREEAMAGNMVITAGGDHSIASATLTAMRSVHEDLCVVWVDAHADSNTPETSPSGNYHGMSAAHAMGWIKPGSLPGFDWLTERNCVPDSRVAFIGVRDIDVSEKVLLRSNAVAVFTMHEIDRWGIGQVVQQALHRVNPHNDRPVHLSFDIDACDPSVAPGTGTLCNGGLSYREAHFICESLSMSNNLVSMDIVEVNPELDSKMGKLKHGDDPVLSSDLVTVRVGTELAISVMGRTIL